MGSLNGRVRDFDLASLKAEKTASRRYEAAIWLKKMVSSEFPEMPSAEEFKSALRNGIILCNAINKVHPGSVSQVVEDPVGSTVPDEVAALRAYQHFENLRNFLVAMQELGLPTFESSDLEQEGTGTGVVNCILALKTHSESETKRLHGPGPQRPGAPSIQSSISGKFVRKNPTLFRSSSFKNSVFEKKNNGSSCVDIKSLETKDRKTSITSKEDLDVNSTSFDWQERQIQELKNALLDIKSGVECMKKQHFEEIARVGKNLQDVVKAASGYHKVLEENRKLYNQVMDLKGNIRVYCRVRPFLPGQTNESSSIGHINEGKITILTPKHGKEGLKSFNFNKVFAQSATQEEVFADMQPLIRSVLDGYNVCIFAYGQTGSGKTHTMAGPKEITKKSMGVNYRALNDLFYLVEKRREIFTYEISVQMIEIYNEQVRDLLSKNGLNQRLEIKNNAQNGLNVPDASLVSVKSTQEVIELMKLGQRNRAVGSTAINDRSSRSHSCLTVHVKSTASSSPSPTILRGSMHLIDLAGSERVEKSEARGERLKEAQHINKSLSALGDVVFAMASRSSHVPYRNSKLTQLLQGSLGGQAKTLMFVHISPEIDAIGETISTLNFAERVSSVELGSAHVNKESSEVKELSQQVVNLKEELARKDKENELLRSMTSTPKVYRTSPRSNQYTGVRGNITPTKKKQISQSTEDKQSTESDSSTLIGSSTSLNNNTNNYKAIDQELCTALDAFGMHTSDNFSQKYTRKLTPKVNGDGLSFKKPHQKTRNNSERSSISLDNYNNNNDEEDAIQVHTVNYSSGKESIKSQRSVVKMTKSKVINGDRSSANKPQEKINKSPDIRPGIPSRSPSQLRKIANGSIQTINLNGRQPTPNSRGIDIKKKPSGKAWK
ncbi:hypothetical protein LUZ60_011419 [Juncus effusus]|nr:hypothetical protein LUZ60_011419 [Juncus effusus]